MNNERPNLIEGNLPDLMERRTGEVSGKDYMILRGMEVHALPQDMTAGVEYTLKQRVINQVRQHMPRGDGKR